MRKPHRTSAQDQMAKVKLGVEKARLAAMESKLEAAKPPPEEPVYTRYEDLPPLSPEDEVYFRNKVETLFYNEGLAQYAQWRAEIERAWESMNAAMGGAPIRSTGPHDYAVSRDTILPEDEGYYRARIGRGDYI